MLNDLNALGISESFMLNSENMGSFSVETQPIPFASNFIATDLIAGEIKRFEIFAFYDAIKAECSYIVFESSSMIGAP